MAGRTPRNPLATGPSLAEEKTMTDEAQKRGVLHWRGMLAEGSVVLRGVVAVVVALACALVVVTQWGYIGVHLADGGMAYLMFTLVPVALAALLLGVWAGAAAGLFLGSVLYFHALVVPLDYYELVYVTPVTSIVATTAFGFAMGMLFSVALRGRSTGWRRALRVPLACLAASGVFSAVFEAGVLWQTQAAAQAMGVQITTVEAAFQAVGDAVALAIVMLAALTVVERAGVRVDLANLRAVFGAWLLGVVLSAFMVVAMLAYGSVTARKLVEARTSMQGEADYLLRQVTHASEYDSEVHQLLASKEGDSPEYVETLAKLSSEGLVTSLIEGYTEDDDGLVVVSVLGKMLGADTDRLGDKPGDALEEYLDADVRAAAQRSAKDGILEQVIYFAPSEYDDLYDLASLGSGGCPSRATPQVGYLVAVEQDGYQVIIIRPVSMVFEGRDDVASWIAASSLGLLLAVSALVWWLLDQLVARRIDATNESLARITEGDLEARVEPGGTREFHELSDGINRTVDTLQDWVAEVEKRMDAEMATARTIQESALPSVFPPYPDIQRFDIYACMEAAKEVGGDFYDFFLIGDDCGPDSGRLAVVMADVSGKGVPSALFMMEAKTRIHDYLESGMELGEAVENANRRLCEGNEESMFVTAWVGVLDYATGHMDFVNAGHNPPLLCKGGSWRWVRELSGMPLGILEELPYPTHSVDCEAGDQILLYTDGVTEAFSVDDEEYGEKHLEDLVRECSDLRPHELVDRVRQSVAAHAEGAEQSDDITLLALEVGVSPERKAQIVVPADVDELVAVFDFINAELDRRLCPSRVQGLLDVAVEELFVNSCSYAYEGTDSDVEPYVRVTCSYSANPVSVTVEIIDEGVPFDPLAQPDEAIDASATLDDIGIGGLGILMAKSSVDEMRYERVGDTNVVTLVVRW